MRGRCHACCSLTLQGSTCRHGSQSSELLAAPRLVLACEHIHIASMCPLLLQEVLGHLGRQQLGQLLQEMIVAMHGAAAYPRTPSDGQVFVRALPSGPSRPRLAASQHSSDAGANGSAASLHLCTR